MLRTCCPFLPRSFYQESPLKFCRSNQEALCWPQRISKRLALKQSRVCSPLFDNWFNYKLRILTGQVHKSTIVHWGCRYCAGPLGSVCASWTSSPMELSSSSILVPISLMRPTMLLFISSKRCCIWPSICCTSLVKSYALSISAPKSRLALPFTAIRRGLTVDIGLLMILHF